MATIFWLTRDRRSPHSMSIISMAVIEHEWRHFKRKKCVMTAYAMMTYAMMTYAMTYNGVNHSMQGHLPPQNSRCGGYAPTISRLVTMTHNTVARQSPLLHHSMQHDRAGKTVILFPDITPVSCSAYSHKYVIRLWIGMCMCLHDYFDQRQLAQTC